MRQILVILEDGEIRQRLMKNIEEALGLTVITKENVTDSLSLLTLLPDIALIIFFPQTADEQDSFLSFWDQMDHRPQLIQVSDLAYSGTNTIHFPYTSLPAQQHWLFIVKMVADIFSIDLYQMADNLIENYVAIASYDLYLFTHAPFDLFLRDEISSTEAHYKRLYRQGKEISRSGLQEQIDQGMKKLYLHEEDLVPFLNLMVERFDQSTLTSALSSKELIFSSREMHLQAIAVLSSIGKSTTFSDLVENSINTIIHAWIKKHRLSKLLNIVMRSDGTMLFQHFSITAILACEMERTRKGKIDRETVEMLTYASFLHDISISYDFYLTQIVDSHRFSKAHISHYDFLRIEQHAKESAAMAKGLGVPEGVENLILHHHGSLEGIGFVENFPKIISPLVHILNIAERFSFSLLEAQYNSTEKVNVTKIINKLADQLNGTSSAAYLNLLKSIFIREKRIEKETSDSTDHTDQHYFGK